MPYPDSYNAEIRRCRNTKCRWGPADNGSLNHVIEEPVSGNRVYLRITGESDYNKFRYSVDGKNFKMLGINQTRYLSSETVGGFTGIMIGLWAQSSSGRGCAEFDYFDYR